MSGNKSSKRLSKDDLHTLESLVREGFTDAQIAEKMGFNEQTIAKRRKGLGLFKTGRGKLQEDFSALPPDEAADALADKTYEQQRLYWLNLLKKSTRYVKLREMFIPLEIKEFEDQWVDYHLMLDDMTAMERDMIEMLIIYRIRIDQNQKDFKQCQELQNELQEQSEGRELDLENDHDLRLREMAIANSNNMIQLNKDIKDLTEKVEKIQRAMNTTREQREKSKNVGQDTFFKLVNNMKSKRQRKESGEYTERMREATDKVLQKFKQPHNFDDGTQEPIYLDGADYLKKEKK